MDDFQNRLRVLTPAELVHFYGGSGSLAYDLAFYASFGVTWMVRLAVVSYERFYPVVLK